MTNQSVAPQRRNQERCARRRRNADGWFGVGAKGEGALSALQDRIDNSAPYGRTDPAHLAEIAILPLLTEKTMAAPPLVGHGRNR